MIFSVTNDLVFSFSIVLSLYKEGKDKWGMLFESQCCLCQHHLAAHIEFAFQNDIIKARKSTPQQVKRTAPITNDNKNKEKVWYSAFKLNSCARVCTLTIYWLLFSSQGKTGKKSYKLAPEDHYWNIVAIVGFEFRGVNTNHLYLDVELESDTGEYENYTKQGKLADWYVDDAPLVVEYAQNLQPDDEVPVTDIWLVQEKIAEQHLHKQDADAKAKGLFPDADYVKALFPSYVPENDRPECCEYQHNIFNVKNYHPVEFPAYFSEKGRMHGASCFKCRKSIMDKFPKDVKTKEDKEKYLKNFVVCGKSEKNWVFACHGLYKDKVQACKKTGVVCNSCYKAAESQSPFRANTSRGRRSQQDGTSPAHANTSRRSLHL